MWTREVKRFIRSKSRIVGSLGQPILFLVALGYGLGPVFQKAGQGNYLEFIAPGIIGMSIIFTAIFNGRAEVRAIARIHGRRANIFSVTDRKIEPVHNHGSFFSGGVPVFSKRDLISTHRLGEEVTAALGKKPAILLRGNGQVTVGRTIPEAVMMAIYLEEAADMLYGALQIGSPIPLTSEESARRKEEALPPVDLERAWNFFKQKTEKK